MGALACTLQKPKGFSIADESPPGEGLIIHTSPIGKKDFIQHNAIAAITKFIQIMTIYIQLRHSQALGGGWGGGGLFFSVQLFKLI